MAVSIEEYLYEEESSTLDFKSEQYEFSGAEDHKKAELLKDILAFANAWRREEAVILIGVKEQKGERSIPVGVESSLDDAALQQFVNSKTNRPITFSYSEVMHDGVKIGLIRIPVQERPFFLKNKYNKLNGNSVYLRRGSSTVEANPDEVYKMGVSRSETVVEVPSVTFQFAKPKNHSLYGSSYEYKATYLEVAERENIPDFKGDPHVFSTVVYREDYYRELVDYYFFDKLTSPVGFAVKNTSSFLVEDVEVVITFEKGVAVFDASSIPKIPKKQHDVYNSLLDSYREPVSYPFDRDSIDVEETNGHHKVVVKFKKLKPQQTVFSCRDVSLAIAQTGDYVADVVIYADNIPDPIRMKLTVSAEVSHQPTSLSRIVDMHNGYLLAQKDGVKPD